MLDPAGIGLQPVHARSGMHWITPDYSWHMLDPACIGSGLTQVRSGM